MDSQQLWSNAQCRPGWLPAVGRRGSRELPPVTYELLTAYDFRARESGKSVFFKALLLVGWPCSSGRPHTPEHLGSTNGTLWVIKINKQII